MTILEAAILGALEGLTEFLPVSSTGHLILAAHALGRSGEAMNAFEIVIQAGALLAVVWLYRARVGETFIGMVRPHPRGRALLSKLFIAFLPAAVVGLLLHRVIKAHLFGPRPVAIALIAGGLLILAATAWIRRRSGAPPFATIDDIPVRVALVIGFAQCLSLWPGTSRAMTTILAALLLGCGPVAAAEFSFLLSLPTLGMATLFDFTRNADRLVAPEMGGAATLLVGLGAAAVVAVLAIRSFLRYVTRRGLEPFGWYRIALGAAVIVFLWSEPWQAP